MAVKRFKELGRTTALIAALATLAAPLAASAQDDRGRGRYGAREASGESRAERPAPQPREDRGSWSRGGEARAPQAAAAPVAAPVRAAEPARRSWSRPEAPAPATRQAEAPDRRSGGWGSVQRDRSPVAAQAPSRAERAAPSETRRSWGRGSTYSDGQRDGTYGGDRRRVEDRNRDGRRDGDRYRDARQGSESRDGSRSGTWWQGDARSRTNDDWRRDRQRDNYRQGYRDDHRRWNRDWRSDNRYNWHDYRSQHRSAYNVGFYYSPYRNYSYRRLSVGFFLDSLFFGNRYWINDPWQYRLPEVYGPYKWVRYYDDVLLVDIYSGEVVDVIHNFFW